MLPVFGGQFNTIERFSTRSNQTACKGPGVRISLLPPKFQGLGNYFRCYLEFILIHRRLTSLLGALVIVFFSTTMITLNATKGGAATAHTSIPTCIQGQLSVAIEEGGYLQPKTPQGYTFLVANDTNHACSMRGFPWWIVFSHSDGSITKVKMLHRSNSLYRWSARSSFIRNQLHVSGYRIIHHGPGLPGEPH